jgi:lipoprotein-anchoring transpeptidase ErfK/SrfK
VIHGWKGDWTADRNQNITWGCISMHNKDLEKFFDVVNLLTPIIITP